MEILSVLVIDDEQGMCLAIQRTLKNYAVNLSSCACEEDVGFSVDFAVSGEEGLAKIEANPPHILLLDNKLPVISGIEVMEKLAETENEILIIMITAYASIETAVRVTKCGAYDFLPKPFSPEELKNVIVKASRHVILSMSAKKLAEEKRQIRFQFISVLAHELKAPINAVEGYLKIVREKSAGDDPKIYDKMLERSLSRIDYMKKLIGDLLDMTSIESGQRERELLPLDLEAAARTALESVAVSAGERGLTLELEVENPRPFTADRNEIDIIFNNLLSNAVKYNKDNGRVEIRIRFDGANETRITVSDTGIGLSADEKEILFKDFVRIRKQETKHVLGSGLGLSTLKKIAEMYDGYVYVESEPGKGSAFTVVLRDAKAPV